MYKKEHTNSCYGTGRLHGWVCLGILLLGFGILVAAFDALCVKSGVPVLARMRQGEHLGWREGAAKIAKLLPRRRPAALRQWVEGGGSKFFKTGVGGSSSSPSDTRFSSA